MYHPSLTDQHGQRWSDTVSILTLETRSPLRPTVRHSKTSKINTGTPDTGVRTSVYSPQAKTQMSKADSTVQSDTDRLVPKINPGPTEGGAAAGFSTTGQKAQL